MVPLLVDARQHPQLTGARHLALGHALSHVIRNENYVREAGVKGIGLSLWPIARGALGPHIHRVCETYSRARIGSRRMPGPLKSSSKGIT